MVVVVASPRESCFQTSLQIQIPLRLVGLFQHTSHQIPTRRVNIPVDLRYAVTEKVGKSFFLPCLFDIPFVAAIMSSNGLLPSFLGALQASLSVLLVIFYGVIATQFNLLDGPTGKTISKVCVKMFLPALLITNLGSELTPARGLNYVLVVGRHSVLSTLRYLLSLQQCMLLYAIASHSDSAPP